MRSVEIIHRRSGEKREKGMEIGTSFSNTEAEVTMSKAAFLSGSPLEPRGDLDTRCVGHSPACLSYHIFFF